MLQHQEKDDEEQHIDEYGHDVQNRQFFCDDDIVEKRLKRLPKAFA